MLIKVQFGHRTGASTSHLQFFRAEFTARPTALEIAEAQIKAGYHPGGYGGPMDINQRLVDDVYFVTWSCWASCD